MFLHPPPPLPCFRLVHAMMHLSILVLLSLEQSCPVKFYNLKERIYAYMYPYFHSDSRNSLKIICKKEVVDHFFFCFNTLSEYHPAQFVELCPIRWEGSKLLGCNSRVPFFRYKIYTTADFSPERVYTGLCDSRGYNKLTFCLCFHRNPVHKLLASCTYVCIASVFLNPKGFKNRSRYKRWRVSSVGRACDSW